MLGLSVGQLLMINELNKWMAFIQMPRTELGGFAICPYAKQAIMQKSYDIQYTNVNGVTDILDNIDITKNDVTILVINDYINYDMEYLVDYTMELNQKYKMRDIVILDNDPRSPMYINGVVSTFEHAYLWIIQSLDDLTSKSQQLSKTNYYSFWTQQQIDEVVTWRKK
jgi:hypothetical protein